MGRKKNSKRKNVKKPADAAAVTKAPEEAAMLGASLEAADGAEAITAPETAAAAEAAYTGEIPEYNAANDAVEIAEDMPAHDNAETSEDMPAHESAGMTEEPAGPVETAASDQVHYSEPPEEVSGDPEPAAPVSAPETSGSAAEDEAPAASDPGTPDEIPGAAVTDDTIVLDTRDVMRNAEAHQDETPSAAAEPEFITALAPVEPVFTTEEAPKKPKAEKIRAFFGDQPVSRKFFAIAMAAALLFNAAVTTGLLALFSGDDGRNGPRPDGRPDSEQSDNDNRGPDEDAMTPPDNSWNDDDQWNSQPNDQWNDDWDDQWDDQQDDRWDDDWDDQWDDQWGGQWNDDQMQPYQQNDSRAAIGIIISENDGVYVTQVTGENAKDAGFQEGDKILSFDGADISTSNDLISEVQKHEPGDKITVKVERDGKSKKIKTVLE